MAETLQVETLLGFTELSRAIQEFATCANPTTAQEKEILSLAHSVEPELLQKHLNEVTMYAVVSAATYHVREHPSGTTQFDKAVERYDRLRYLLDTQIEQRAMTQAHLKQVEALLSNLKDDQDQIPQLTKHVAAVCTNTIYSDFSNQDLVDALTANTEPNSQRSIVLKDLATLTCHNLAGSYRYTLQPLEGRAPELTDVLSDVYQSFSERLDERSIFHPARYAIEPNLNSNRAQESRTESEATSMATTIDAVMDAPETTTKQHRRGSKTKEERPAPAPEVASIENEPSSTDNHTAAEEQKQLAAMEKQSGAPVKSSYLRQTGGYDALNPEQKAACDKDFQAYLAKQNRPIEQREGESPEQAMLRAKDEYCCKRQEHTAQHGKIAQTMLKSKINCLAGKYDSYSLMNPDVAKEFLATAFYHNATTAKGIKEFDRDLFAQCRSAALREWSKFSSSVETGAEGKKEFNNAFNLKVERPGIGSKSNNLRISVEPLAGKREDVAAVFGKCAFYHSNRSGRTPEEKEQRRVARTKQTADMSR